MRIKKIIRNDNKLVISTWQSLVAMMRKKKYKAMMEIFDAIILDEAHHLIGKSLTTIFKKAKNSEHKIGCTGTFPDKYSNDYYNITGTLGPPREYVSYKELTDLGFISKMKLFTIALSYPEIYRQENYDLNMKQYQITTKSGKRTHSM